MQIQSLLSRKRARRIRDIARQADRFLKYQSWQLSRNPDSDFSKSKSENLAGEWIYGYNYQSRYNIFESEWGYEFLERPFSMDCRMVGGVLRKKGDYYYGELFDKSHRNQRVGFIRLRRKNCVMISNFRTDECYDWDADLIASQKEETWSPSYEIIPPMPTGPCIGTAFSFTCNGLSFVGYESGGWIPGMEMEFNRCVMMSIAYVTWTPPEEVLMDMRRKAWAALDDMDHNYRGTWTKAELDVMESAHTIVNGGHGLGPHELFWFRPDCLNGVALLYFCMGGPAEWDVFVLEPVDGNISEYRAIVGYKNHARPLETSDMTNSDWEIWLARAGANGNCQRFPRVGWAAFVQESRRTELSALYEKDICSRCKHCRRAKEMRDLNEALFDAFCQKARWTELHKGRAEVYLCPCYSICFIGYWPGGDYFHFQSVKPARSCKKRSHHVSHRPRNSSILADEVKNHLLASRKAETFSRKTSQRASRDLKYQCAFR